MGRHREEDRPRTGKSEKAPIRHGSKPDNRSIHVKDAAGRIDWDATSRLYPIHPRDNGR
jgi:hypothetical protein